MVLAAFPRPPALLLDEPFDPAVESFEVRVQLPLLLANAEGPPSGVVITAGPSSNYGWGSWWTTAWSRR